MKTCKSANARVGAIGKFIDSIKAEIEVGQSLGLLPKQISPAVVVNQNNVTQVNAKTETKLMIDVRKKCLKMTEKPSYAVKRLSQEQSNNYLVVICSISHVILAMSILRGFKMNGIASYSP